MSTADISVTDISNSLTGFEEIAITQNFNANVGKLFETDVLMFSRALVFTYERRAGKNVHDAMEVAMSMGRADVNDYFLPEEEDAMPDEPDSESGKGDSSSE